MEVDKTMSFAVNNGLIVHNCIDSTRYSLQDDMTYGNEWGKW